MSGLRDIRRRIISVKSTQKITRAMRMVAAAKLRRAQDAIIHARPYAYHLRALVQNLAMRAEEGRHVLLRKPASGKAVFIVVTSDRGLCGGYNSTIVQAAAQAVNEYGQDRETALVVIGRKGIEQIRRRKLNVLGTHTGVMDGNVMQNAQQILDGLVDEFARGEIAEIHCVYNEFKSALVQRVTVEQLLPVETPADDVPAEIDYVYEPSVESVLSELLTHSLYMQMHRILFEAAASEHGARMTAMESATKNAGDMIGRLTLQYNRARQDAITKEMLEIIGGAEAL